MDEPSAAGSFALGSSPRDPLRLGPPPTRHPPTGSCPVRTPSFRDPLPLDTLPLGRLLLGPPPAGIPSHWTLSCWDPLTPNTLPLDSLPPGAPPAGTSSRQTLSHWTSLPGCHSTCSEITEAEKCVCVLASSCWDTLGVRGLQTWVPPPPGEVASQVCQVLENMFSFLQVSFLCVVSHKSYINLFGWPGLALSCQECLRLMVCPLLQTVDDTLHSLDVCPMSVLIPVLTWFPLVTSQAIDSIHQVGVYCLALVPANTLPKTPLGGIHLSETKQLFLEGSLHPCNVLMCPHTCVTNLPKPRQKQPGMCDGPGGWGIWTLGTMCCWCHANRVFLSTDSSQTLCPPGPLPGILQEVGLLCVSGDFYP